MRVIIELDIDGIIAALCLSAVNNPDLLDRNLNRPQIREIVTNTITSHGREATVYWADDQSERQTGHINGWATAQVTRYKF